MAAILAYDESAGGGGYPMVARVSKAPVPDHHPPVVLVHGLIVSSRYLVPTAELLGRSFRVLAPDLPGFGRSAKPKRPLSLVALVDALAEWITAMHLGRVAIVGNSMGCQFGVELALRHPQLVSRLVLQGPTVDSAARSALGQTVRWLQSVPRERLGLGRIMVADFFSAGFRRAIYTFRELLDDPIEDKLPRVEVPVLVVRGSKDPISSQRWCERILELVPDSRLRVIPGGAHTLVYSMPRELVRVIRPFLLEDATATTVAA